MKHITTKEFLAFKKGKKTKNWKIIQELLKGGERQYENKRRSL